MITDNLDTDLIQRLRTEMFRKSINARELAEKANVGRSFVYDVLSGKNSNPTTKKLSSIANVLGVSLEYLLNGGESTPSDASTPLAQAGQADELVAIPSISVQASASGGTLVTEEDPNKFYYFHRSWIRDKVQSSRSDLRIIFVTGDNMAPTLDDNDMVLVDLSRNVPSPAGIYVLYDGIGLVIKRLESVVEKSGKRMVHISSDNPHYPPYTRSAEEINVIGRVVWFARELIWYE